MHESDDLRPTTAARPSDDERGDLGPDEIDADAGAASDAPPAGRARNWGARRESRLGIMLHYDASAGLDVDALGWFSDPRCRVSYNWLYLDDGAEHEIAPDDARAWHAGACRPSDPARLAYGDANSAFWGLAWAGGGRPGDVCPEAARAAIVRRCVTLFRRRGWPAEETWRIVSHRSEAWPRGRKDDPEGPGHPRRTVLSTHEIRSRVAAALRTGRTTA